MPLPSGAHVLLDDDEFFIDRSVPQHYIKRWFDADEETDPNVVGAPGKKKFNAESLFWTYDDWAGGEGNRNYYEEDYDKYDVAYELNPRIRGQLTGRPNRRRTTVGTKEISDRPAMTVGAGAAWIGGGYELHYCTSDPTSWTSKATSGTAASDFVGLRSLNTNYRITAICGHNDYVYYAAWNSANSGERAVLRAVKSDAALADTVEQEATGVAPYAGLAIMNDKLYAWTGRKLFEMDTTASSITTSVSGGVTTGAGTKRKVYDTGADPVSTNVFSTNWWAEAIATENSIIMWYSNDGVSRIYEFKKGVGRPIWTPPYGFTVKGSCYANGVAYFSGHWGGDENASGVGVLYALPLDSYRPIELKMIRDSDNVNLQMQEMHASYGYQVITVAQRTGRIFVYDARTDGLTMLDDIEADPDSGAGADVDSVEFDDNDHRIAGSLTWGAYRLFTIYRPGGSGSGSYQVLIYDDDRPEQRETGLTDNPTSQYEFYKGYFQSSRWDYNYPMDMKSLIGFHLTFKPLVSGQTLDVSYDHNDDGTYTSLTQITSATAGASVGRVFIPVSTTSSQVQFYSLKYRVKLASSSGVATPILYAVTAEAKLVRKRLEWELVLRLKDEPSNNRAANAQRKGWSLRDYITATIEAGNVITFRDAYRYDEAREYGTPYSTHNVVIKQAEDVIEKPGEGSMRVLLRSVDA
jgi:hypothetical protein